MTELQIVNGVKNGDREAMRTMYDLLAGSAMATAVRYLGDSDEFSGHSHASMSFLIVDKAHCEPG